MDLISPHLLDQTNIYRLREPDQLNKFGQQVFAPTRYIAIMPGGKILCSCLKQIHHGIPCQHYFAVWLRLRQIDIPFSIRYFNRHWILPNRWVEYADEPLVRRCQVASISIAETESRNFSQQSAEIGARGGTAPNVAQARAVEYGDCLNLYKQVWSRTSEISARKARLEKLLKDYYIEIQMEDEMLTGSQWTAPLTPSNQQATIRDPIPVYTPHKRRYSRIKSCTERTPKKNRQGVAAKDVEDEEKFCG